MKRRTDGRYTKTKTIDGRKVQFYSSAETERAALKDIELQMLEFTRTRFSRKHNFKMLADAALESQSRSISHNTVETYSYSLKHLEPFFDLNIEDITASMLQDLLNEMSAEKYSFSAISKTKTTFGLVLNYAIVKEGLSLDNFSVRALGALFALHRTPTRRTRRASAKRRRSGCRKDKRDKIGRVHR